MLGASVLFHALAPLTAKAAEPSPQDAIRAGYERLYSGDPDGAYEHFRALAQAAPDNLAAAYLRLAEALEKNYPENPFYQFRLACLYAHPQVEDYERADEKYRNIAQRAEQGHPHYKGGTRYNAILGLVRVSQQQWRLEEAIKINEWNRAGRNHGAGSARHEPGYSQVPGAAPFERLPARPPILRDSNAPQRGWSRLWGILARRQ